MLFNHESELRGREFVTRKISSQLAEMVMGRTDPIELGNLNATRDWGYARDYTQAMQLIAESDCAGDYVIATNTSTSVREFFAASASYAGFHPVFEGEGLSEKCFDSESGRLLCRLNKAYFRPVDAASTRGDSSKMFDTFGWFPATKVKKIAKIMVDFDIALLRGEL